MSHSTLRAKRATFRVGKTVLPDRSLLIGQKLVENAKMRHLELIFKQCDCSEKDNPLGIFCSFVDCQVVSTFFWGWRMSG